MYPSLSVLLQVREKIDSLTPSIPNLCDHYNFTLAEEPRLVITPAQPEYTAALGNPLAFTCKAEVPDPTLITDLKWISPEGLEIGVGDRISTDIYYQNGDTPTNSLEFSSFHESDSGNYTCRATYTSSQTLSASVKLSNQASINWIDVPTEQRAILGKEYTVRCNVTANPAPRVRWLKDGVAISKNCLRLDKRWCGYLYPKRNTTPSSSRLGFFSLLQGLH
ncbi:fasciclin-2-like isoform X2 [Artemia franciscana]|uniref:fasciclin-2-like isoform X2 n=1 Tax=Artemia franciscana TaxID=6661 RepID=UPI0032DA0D3E